MAKIPVKQDHVLQEGKNYLLNFEYDGKFLFSVSIRGLEKNTTVHDVLRPHIINGLLSALDTGMTDTDGMVKFIEDLENNPSLENIKYVNCHLTEVDNDGLEWA